MEKKWTAVIVPKNRIFDLKLKELWKYKDLIALFVKRNFVTRYKQTILGPLWFIIQPLFTTLMQTLVFGTIAGFEDSVTVPYTLFSMAGNVAWTYFSGCLSGTSNTFVANSGMFSKVYFPRMVAPISTVMTGMIDFALQFGMLTCFYVGFKISGAALWPSWALVLIPVLVIQMALLGMGLGTIISSLTTKYRDLQVFVSFGVSLLMYATPIIYTAESVFLESEALYIAMMVVNPMASIVEVFKYGVLGSAAPYGMWMFWGISWSITILVVLLGMIMFNRIEKTFLDTV